MDLLDFLVDAVERSGGLVLYASEAKRAPVYLGVQGINDERIGLLVYLFRATQNVIRNGLRTSIGCRSATARKRAGPRTTRLGMTWP